MVSVKEGVDSRRKTPLLLGSLPHPSGLKYSSESWQRGNCGLNGVPNRGLDFLSHRSWLEGKNAEKGESLKMLGKRRLLMK